jgi:hypothetical protein
LDNADEARLAGFPDYSGWIDGSTTEMKR